MLTIYGYTKCSTVKKSLKFLDNNNVEYEFIDFVENKLTKEELKNIHKLSNLPIKRLFNTSGNLYKELNLKDKVNIMSDDKCYELLSTNGMLVKRPIFLKKDVALIGFNETIWSENI